MIKVSDYIAKRITALGVKDIFMISGGGAMHLNDSFGKQKGLNYICNHNEQATAISAEGYARVKGKMAVVNVTTGPGGINCLNGVFGQYTDSVPVLYISGQVKFETTIYHNPKVKIRQIGDQEADIVSIVKPIVKYAKIVKNAYDIGKVLDEAIYHANIGRKGPVWIDVPMNIQGAMIDEKKLKRFVLPKAKKEDYKISQVISALKKAKRPIVVAGNGINVSGARAELKKFLTKFNLPVLTTFNGLDIIEDANKNYIGRIGTVGQRAGNFALQNADVILFLGTRNNIRQISYNWENFTSRAKTKIAVDIDGAELNKHTLKLDVKIQADALKFLQNINKKTAVKCSNEWLKWCQVRKIKYDPSKVYPTGTKNKLNAYYFVSRLTEHMKDKDVMVAANASACVCAFQNAKIKKQQRVFWNSGNASMGYCLPAVIGAGFANNKKPVVCLAGEGSLMMNLQELHTIKHHNLPVKIFILNNNGYISIIQTQDNFFKGRMTACTTKSGISFPNFEKIAKGFELDYLKINDPKKMDAQIKKALAFKKPIVCEVVLEKDYIFTPKTSSKKLPNGKMISAPLEDMYPFLSRKEFDQNMIKD